MSKRRFSPKKRIKKDDKGKNLCRYCEGAIKPPRRTFCGEACVHEYKLRRSSSYVRRFMLKRDKGICQICGINAHILKKEGKRILTYQGKEKYKEFAKLHHMPPERKSWWDADHIVPVSLNGGECGLEGYRTLCIPCHKDVTRELQKILMANRAAEKKKEKENAKKKTTKRSIVGRKRASRRVFED